MTFYKAIFLFLTIINLSSQQCDKNKRMEWCIHSDYVGEGDEVVDRDSCKERPCIVSTCPYDYMNYNKSCLSMKSLALNFSEITALYRIDSKTGMPVKTNQVLNNTRFQIVSYKGKPYLNQNNNCTSQFVVIEKGQTYYGHFLENGSFLLLPPRTILPAGEYIVRFTVSDDQKHGLKPQLRLKFAMRQSLDEVEQYMNKVDQYMDKVFAYAMAVSCLFMILLLIVYVLCKDLRTTAGLLLMTYVAVLTITYLLILTRELSLLNKVKLGSIGCFIISVLFHFFVFSSFFWMNIMGFDIWWTLRTMYYHGAGGKKGVDFCKFMWYCCIASVPPLIYVIIEVCLDVYTEGYGPKFADCSICSNKWYVAGMVLPLQAFNFIPFVLTIYKLWQIQSSTRNHLNNSCSGNTGPATQNALLSIKISVMMGTNWFVDVLLLIFYDSFSVWFIYTAKMYNSLFGFILFIVYIFKSDVLLRLFRRLSIDNGITRHLERRVSRQHGSLKSRKYSVQSSSSATAAQAVNSSPDTDNTDV